MRNLICLALLAACHAPASSTLANAPAAPKKLGPSLTQAELDARLADHRLRRPDVERLPDDGGDVGGFSSLPGIKISGDVVSTLNCRPGGASHSIAADASYLYIYSVEEPPLVAPPGPHGEARPTPSTYCSYQRFRIPAGLAYGGELKIER